MAGPDERLVRLSEDEAARLARLYADAEREILAEINRALLKGNKTQYLRAMQANTQAILRDLRAGSRQWTEEAIPRVYIEGAKFAENQVAKRGGQVIAGFAAIHQQAVQVLAEVAYNRFDETVVTIGRRVDDIYRTMTLENVRGTVVGYRTWQQAAKGIRDRLADQGVTGFKDTKGRNWNMKTYSEMAARTTTMEAHLQGTANRLLEHGRDLIVVSDHNRECEKCRPWERKVLSLTGRTEGYPTLEQAKEAGLFHANCRHAYSLYIDIDAEIKEGSKGSGRSGPAKPQLYADVPGLTEKARKGLAKAFAEAQDHGLKTGRECLLHTDAKTGKQAYNKISGGKDQVAFPPDLITFLDNAQDNSLVSIHNHPNSSSFSDADLAITVSFRSFHGMAVIGHDGTRYFVGLEPGSNPDATKIQADWRAGRAKYYTYYLDRVQSGKMTTHDAWKEHSHKILEYVAQLNKLIYRRWLPNE